MKRPIILVIIAVLVLIGLYWYFNQNEQNSSEIVLYGNVDIREANLGFRVFGKLDQMKFEEGDRVKKEAILAALDKIPFQDDVDSAKADIAQKTAAYENSVLVYNRKRELLKTQFISQQVFDDALSARDQAKAALLVAKANFAEATTRYSDTDLKAPSDGTIITRVREPGTIVNPGDTAYVLALDDPIWVRTYINETQLGLIYPGMEVDVYTDSRNGQPYKGKIGFISPVAEFTPKTVETAELRTKLVYRIRIPISNKDRYLRQGMPVTVKIRLRNNES